MPVPSLSPQEVEQLEANYQTGTMPETLRPMWEKNREHLLPSARQPTTAAPSPPAADQPDGSVQVHIEPALGGGVERTLEARDTSGGTPEPTPPAERTWGQAGGRFALEVGIPFALALLTRNPAVARTTLQRAMQTGATGFTGTALGSLTAETFDPSAHPMESAARKGLEAGGAGAVGGLVGHAPEGASLLTRGAVGGTRALATGGGAASGSLAAEPFDPSADPWGRAATVGGYAAGTQGAWSLLGTALPLVGAGRRQTPLQREVSDTMAEQGTVIPSSATESRTSKVLSFLGEHALGGGRLMARGYRNALDTFSDALDNVMDGMRGGQTPAQVRDYTDNMYDTLRTFVGQHMSSPTRPVYVQAIQEPATALALSIPTTAGGIHAQMRALGMRAAPRDVLNLQEATRLHADAQALLTQARAQGVAGPFLAPLETLTTNLGQRLTSNEVVDLRPVQGTLRQFAAWAEPHVPGADVSAMLIRLNNMPDFVSWEDATTLRSVLLSVARAAQGGGQGRAPTPGGGAVVPGMGGRFGNTLGASARTIAGDVDTQVSRTAMALHPVVETQRLAANAARVRQEQTEWLAQRFEGARDKITGLLKPEMLMDSIGRTPQQDALADMYGVNLTEIERLARAMAFYPHAAAPMEMYRTSRLPRMEGIHTRVAGPLTQYATAGLAYATGHPIVAFFSVLTPEMAGFLLSSPRLTSYFARGLAMPPGSQEYARFASGLAGVVMAEMGMTQQRSQQQGQAAPVSPALGPLPNAAPVSGAPEAAAQ